MISAIYVFISPVYLMQAQYLTHFVFDVAFAAVSDVCAQQPVRTSYHARCG
jgi:hypothetical protein